MSNFNEGETIWLLEPPTSYRKTPKEYISKCVYRGKYLSRWTNGKKEYLHTIQRINPDGGLGLTFNVPKEHGTKIFGTLEELKSWLIQVKLNDISNQQRIINDINLEISEIKSLRDISEERENKITELLS